MTKKIKQNKKIIPNTKKNKTPINKKKPICIIIQIQQKPKIIIAINQPNKYNYTEKTTIHKKK